MVCRCFWHPTRFSFFSFLFGEVPLNQRESRTRLSPRSIWQGLDFVMFSTWPVIEFSLREIFAYCVTHWKAQRKTFRNGLGRLPDFKKEFQLNFQRLSTHERALQQHVLIELLHIKNDQFNGRALEKCQSRISVRAVQAERAKLQITFRNRVQYQPERSHKRELWKT